MWKFLRAWLTRLIRTKQVEPVEKPVVKERNTLFSTHVSDRIARNEAAQNVLKKVFQVELPQPTVPTGVAMDSKHKATMDSGFGIKQQFAANTVVPVSQLYWYASQSFIGFNMCAILSQHWLVMQACEQPAKDACRNGYEVTINNGKEIDADILDKIRQADKLYDIKKNLVEFVQFGKVFGIRIAIFLVESKDPDYYKKPFNPDGVTKGSYRGITQIDPMWVAPILDNEAAGNPAAKHFYDPTWWTISGLQVHRSHLVIFRTEELPDILKPTYQYAGVSVPQKIYERVYAAERTANEAPMLAMSKRIGVIKTDITKALADEVNFDIRMAQNARIRDNYGERVIGEDDEYNQFDTSLADLDAVIMSQYQIVAAIAKVPAVKLLGTSPKGFNATGEFEEASYHEELQSLQEHKLTPLLDRHHLLLIRSEIAPDSPFETTVVWNELDAMTGKEQAELNKAQGELSAVLIQNGVISPEEERKRLINNPSSGYTGLEEEAAPGLPDENDNDSDRE